MVGGIIHIFILMVLSKSLEQSVPGNSSVIFFLEAVSVRNEKLSSAMNNLRAFFFLDFQKTN